ncbi:hypothetical protein FRB99_008447 [Tulasnella sp. 403]|nr:hypothetical protein FRB99_008447 [Tulasnella sp. 403]
MPPLAYANTPTRVAPTSLRQREPSQSRYSTREATESPTVRSPYGILPSSRNGGNDASTPSKSSSARPRSRSRSRRKAEGFDSQSESDHLEYPLPARPTYDGGRVTRPDFANSPGQRGRWASPKQDEVGLNRFDRVRLPDVSLPQPQPLSSPRLPSRPASPARSRGHNQRDQRSNQPSDNNAEPARLAEQQSWADRQRGPFRVLNPDPSDDSGSSFDSPTARRVPPHRQIISYNRTASPSQPDAPSLPAPSKHATPQASASPIANSTRPSLRPSRNATPFHGERSFEFPTGGRSTVIGQEHASGDWLSVNEALGSSVPPSPPVRQEDERIRREKRCSQPDASTSGQGRHTPIFDDHPIANEGNKSTPQKRAKVERDQYHPGNARTPQATGGVGSLYLKKNDARKEVEETPRNATERPPSQDNQRRNHAILGLVDGLGLGLDWTGDNMHREDPDKRDRTPHKAAREALVYQPSSFEHFSGYHGSSSGAPYTQSSSDDSRNPQPLVSRQSSEAGFGEYIQQEGEHLDDQRHSPTYDVEDNIAMGLTAATSWNRISTSPHLGSNRQSSESNYIFDENASSGNDALFIALGQPSPNRHPTSTTARDWSGSSDHQKPLMDPIDGDGRSSPSAHGKTLKLPSRTDTFRNRDSIAYRRTHEPQREPHPTITVQPSTSASSGGGLPRVVSVDSVSLYSEGEPHVEANHEADMRGHDQPPAAGEDDNQDWSDGAQRLIRALGRNAQASSSSPRAPVSEPRQNLRSPISLNAPSPTSPSHSTQEEHAMGHDGPTVVREPPQAPQTWKESLRPDAQRSLLEKYGALEMRRQEVIWELCATEQAFVQSLRTVLRLFVQPLLTKERKWIPGIPGDIAKLFDWLDDIVQLHSQISRTLLEVRSAQYPVVLQVAESLRSFVPCLELHQPYLVRLESVTHAIEGMVHDKSSDLGEFFRLKTALPECGSMPLTSFLLKPAQRLMKYPLFFKQLWELTPRNHPDYLATFSLLHSTDMMIKAMQEVKAREDEYDLVKSLAERILGLPPGFALARRDRRLIAQGMLRRVYPGDKEQALLLQGSASSRSRSSSAKSSANSTPSTQDSTPPSTFSKLFPITSQFASSSFGYRRQDSVSSDLSNTPSVHDFSSDGSRSTSSSSNMMSTSNTERSFRTDSIASSISTWDQDYPLPAGGGFMDPKSLRRRSSFRGKSKRETQIYVFVFTDFVLLTAPLPDRNIMQSPKKGESKECWKVLDDVGIARVLGVTNLSGQLNHDHLISVDLLPMNPGHDMDPSESTCAFPVYLSLPDRMTSRMALAPPHILEDARAKWLEAFERCFQHTLRSLCFPVKRKHDPIDEPLNFSPDSGCSVMSMLSSGLPLPKSPSQQMIDSRRGTGGDGVEQERAERGWWSAQFHKVLRELERPDVKVTYSGHTEAAMTLPVQPRRSSEKRMSTGPRPLLLGTRNAGSAVTTPSKPTEERKGLLRSFTRKTGH